MSSDEMPDVHKDTDTDRRDRVNIENIEIFEQDVKQERRQTQLGARKKKKKGSRQSREELSARQESNPQQSYQNSQVKLMPNQS